jgi:putative oxidoreductase
MARSLPSPIRPLTGPAGDLALLLARVVLGVVLIAHGWQKVFEYGFSGVTASFAKLGVPAPPVSAAYASVVELVGGVLLLAGVLTTVVGVLVVLDMLGAFLFVHAGHGIFVESQGWELVAVIAVGALLLVGAGAGRFSVDHVINRRRRTAVPA